MAHTCETCGMTCHCGGDIDDMCLETEEALNSCTHCPDEGNDDDDDDDEPEFD